MIDIVVACARNGVIGTPDGMPWVLPGDLKRFKQLTMGCPVIMGRTTFEHIGRALPNRTNIVVTRHATKGPADDVIFRSSVDDAIECAVYSYAQSQGTGTIKIIGGEQVYRAALPYVTRVFLTLVHGEPKGTARFPLDRITEGWREVERVTPQHDRRDSHTYEFVTLLREGSQDPSNAARTVF